MGVGKGEERHEISSFRCRLFSVGLFWKGEHWESQSHLHLTQTSALQESLSLWGTPTCPPFSWTYSLPSWLPPSLPNEQSAEHERHMHSVITSFSWAERDQEYGFNHLIGGNALTGQHFQLPTVSKATAVQLQPCLTAMAATHVCLVPALKGGNDKKVN